MNCQVYSTSKSPTKLSDRSACILLYTHSIMSRPTDDTKMSLEIRSAEDKHTLQKDLNQLQESSNAR